MSVYLISYDLNKTGQDYASLYEAIKSLGDWAHYLESTWFVDTNYSADQIKDNLMKIMDSNDNLFVTKIVYGYAGWLKKDAWPWLSAHVKD